MSKAYLDTSVIVKRYIHEEGSQAVAQAYSMADATTLNLAFSIWNIGEAIGVINRYEQRGLISQEHSAKALSGLARETMRLTKIAMLEVLSVSSSLLVESWLLIKRYNIYQADAIQITSSRRCGADFLLTADKKLVSVARSEGLDALNVKDQEGIKARLSAN